PAGLGRVSNYIDEAKPSDVNTALKYFSIAKSSRTSCLRGINARRAVYGLGAISQVTAATRSFGYVSFTNPAGSATAFPPPPRKRGARDCLTSCRISGL